MREPEFDPRFVDWLHDGPSAPAGWVLPAVEHHARRHPRRRDLLARWSDAMRTVALRHPLAPAARAVVVVAAFAVTVALGGAFLSGSPGIIGGPAATSTAAPGTTETTPPSSPVPSVVPTSPPSPSALDPAAMLGQYLPAWHGGDLLWGQQWVAPDHHTVLIGPPGLDLQYGAEHFEIIPNGRGYVYWERRGDPLHGGELWALPSVAGVWDPGNLVWAILRLNGEGRIATQWLVARQNPLAAHEAEGTYATPAPDDVVTFLDTCREAFSHRHDEFVDYRRAAIDCYTPDAGAWISDNDPSGAWTETYTDGSTSNPDGPIGAWTQASGRYDAVERTGGVVMLGNIAAYPFRQPISFQQSNSASSCAAGIDVLELTPEHDRIRSHWVFCGPDPLPPTSLPSDVTGTWGVRPRDLLSVTLGTCDWSGVCGELRWHCHGEDCAAPLTYRGTQEDALAFEVTDANTFGCRYDLLGSTVLVEPTSDGLEVSTLGFLPGRSGVTLPWTDASPSPSASPGG